MEPMMSVQDGGQCVLILDPMQLRRAEIASFLAPWAEASGVSITTRPLAPVDAHFAQGCRMVILCLGGIPFSDPEPQRHLRELLALAPHQPIVILSDRETLDDIVCAFRSGARGYIPTSTEPAVALQALTFIMNGGHFFPPAALLLSQERPGNGAEGASKNGRFPGQPDSRPGNLTTRQQEVLDLLRLGKPNKLIARELSMCEATVKVHVRQIMRKLGATNRTQAALICAADVRLGMPEPDDRAIAPAHEDDLTEASVEPIEPALPPLPLPPGVIPLASATARHGGFALVTRQRNGLG